MKTLWLILMLALLAAAGCAYERLQGPTELRYWDKSQTYDGYTFFGAQGATYLLDMEGRVVHTWPVGTNPRLLDNGHVLDATNASGFVELDWDGSPVWSHTEARAGYFPHGDFLRIYNPKLGSNTTLYIANKAITSNQCIAAGCNPANSAYADVTVDAIVEVDAAGTVVWEWCFFDHGAQDYSAAKSNYVASIANAAGRINLNLPGRPLTNDWLHCVSLDYNAARDQIVITAEGGEFYVIDHGNTFLPGNPAGSIALAAGAGGDFLYRFGDPARYNAGNPPSVLLNWTKSTTGHKQIGGVGQTIWIPTNAPGAGHFLVFNNGQDLFESTPQSYVFEVNGYLNAATNETGAYVSPPSAGYNTWSPPGHDTDKEKKSISRQVVSIQMAMANQAFFSPAGGSVQRLPNSNTLVCAAAEGHIFEMTPSTNVVWEYISPVTTNGVVAYKRDDWPLANAVWRAARYSAAHPALAGRTLSGTNTIARSAPSYISAPTISGVTQTPASPLSTDAVTVSAAVTNNRTVASVTLTYMTGAATNSLSMAPSGTLYTAQIPASAAGAVVRYFISAKDDFDMASTSPASAPTNTLSYTVGGVTNLPPVVGTLTQAPVAPTHADAVTITAQATDDVGVASVFLSYSIGTGGLVTNTAFAETMATSPVNPWTGGGCDNAWTVSYKGNNPFQQAGNAHYGSGNTNGLTFKNGTTNLADSTITTASGINARGTNATLAFYLQTSIVAGNAAWALQLNPGTGFTTRLSGQTTTNQNWQLYSYALQPADLVSNLFVRFQFGEGNVSNRVFLDQISVRVVTNTRASTTLAMSALGGDQYAAQIPPQTNGAMVSYEVTAWDTLGLCATAGGSYQVSDAGAFPVAAFSAAPTNGGAPLEVAFMDVSEGIITNRFWSFGDGGATNTTATTVAHTYALPGTCTVQLVVSGPLGTSTQTRTGLVAAVAVDTVGDGVPDWWRAQWFGGGGRTTNDQSCADADPDGDLMSNGQEFLADTNPTNGASILAFLALSPHAGGLQATWVGGVAATQVVECQSDLGRSQEEWSAIYTNVPPTAVTNTVVWTNGVSLSNGFYRIRVWR